MRSTPLLSVGLGDGYFRLYQGEENEFFVEIVLQNANAKAVIELPYTTLFDISELANALKKVVVERV